MQIITQTADLRSACRHAAQADFVTVDTEFHRENTYWPILCLIQLGHADDALIIDPLSDDIDLSPFFELMSDTGVTKVFHAARQDIEIIHYLAGIIPTPLFDTQIAAMVCGFGDSVGYINLVQKLLDEILDKSAQYTDWRRRPLSVRQLTYALGDVTWLRDVYTRLRKQLDESGRAPWLDEEMAVLTDPATYAASPETAWTRLKLRVRKTQQLGVLVELAKWRETAAQTRNIPRRRVLKDDAIYDIANQMPATVDKLAQLRSVSEKLARSHQGSEIVLAVKKGLVRDPATLPPLSKSRRPSADVTATIELLRVLLKTAAARHDVAQKLIATAADLEKIALKDSAAVRALKGWRFDLFGRDALALKRGELALVLRNGNVESLAINQTVHTKAPEISKPQSESRAPR